MAALGGDNVDYEFAAFVIEIENLCRQALTVVKREEAHRANVGLVQPVLLGKFGD